MGRRKKEPRSVHRDNIAAAASALFSEKGVAATSMDEIAKAAGYSKATLYVYFQNKDEIVSVLALESMRKLCACIASALEGERTTRGKYDLICQALVGYQAEYPFYFQMTLEKLTVDFSGTDHFPEDKETYQVGEEINAMIASLLRTGMAAGDLRGDLDVAPTAFSCWGMLAGLILLAANKAGYIQSAMGLSREAFLRQGFDMVYRSVEKGRENHG